VDGAPTETDGLLGPHLRGLAIFKMTGSGNDFVMVDGRHTSPAEWSEADIRAVCARGTGVGADGLVFLSPGSQPNAIRMVYFNSDGSRAAMCGNAALCTTRLAARLGMASAQGMILETDAGTYASRCAEPGERAELRVAPVRVSAPVPGLSTTDGEGRTALGTVGVPHLVILVDDLDTVDLMGRGRALRFDPALGPDGANVNFISPAGAESEWLMRTYERGVEGETLACGTGAVAAACALVEWGVGRLPVTIWTRSGRRLEIDGRRLADGTYDDVWLRGEARLVLRGVIN
jgi:diaminopimelate epimerase